VFAAAGVADGVLGTAAGLPGDLPPLSAVPIATKTMINPMIDKITL
jgi:hypothetical protein